MHWTSVRFYEMGVMQEQYWFRVGIPVDKNKIFLFQLSYGFFLRVPPFIKKLLKIVYIHF